MLKRNRAPAADNRTFSDWNIEGEFIGLSDILVFVKTNIMTIVLCALLGAAGAVFYVVTSDKIYTARTQILIQPKIPQLLQEQAKEVNLSLDTSQVETQLAVLRSEKIATMVIDELDLTRRPDFKELSGTAMGERLQRMLTMAAGTLGLDESRFFRFFSSPADDDMSIADSAAASAADPEFEIRRRAIDTFNEGLAVNRVGVSYAIDIFFSSRDPELSAQLANATADAFVREQLETRTAAASEGLSWLQERIEEVRTQMNEAVQAAQEFRARHDYRIVGTGEEQTGPTLEELEVTADTYRRMYESLLAAFTSSVDQQPYLIADARVITTATRPLGPSHPRKSLILAFGMTAGLMAGVGFASARHLLDRTVRSPRQVQEELGMDCIGELPVVWFRRSGFGRFDEAARRPESTFARNLKGVVAAIAAADVEQPVRTIGITSALPGDGKSTVASNLAVLYAQSGLPTLLIDADVYYSTLTQSLRPVPALVDETKDDLTETGITRVRGQLFDLLPNPAVEICDLLSPGELQQRLKAMADYEMIVVDLPPFTSSASGLDITPLLDGVIVIAEWGKTPLDLVADLSRALRATRTSLLGVLMTKVRSPSTHRYHMHARHIPR